MRVHSVEKLLECDVMRATAKPMLISLISHASKDINLFLRWVAAGKEMRE